MRIMLVSLVTGTLVLAGCATPKREQWHNSLYERDNDTGMRHYYGRDFNICLGRALQASTAGLIDPRSIEPETNECLRKGGWIETTD